MMSTRVIACSVGLLLACLVVSEGMSLRSLGMEQHCRCIGTEDKTIGRHIEKVELIPVNSHCDKIEIIATMKNSGAEICLDPKAPWVQRVIKKIMTNKRS